MKVLFLDIDGVLNSDSYDKVRGENEGNIDITRMCLLKTIIDKTGAQIVLSSTWRKNWDRDFSKCNEKGKEIYEVFTSYGLEIFDKTPYLRNDSSERPKEIKMWLDSHRAAENYAILDDHMWGWREMEEHLVRTSGKIGRGLMEKHVNEVIEILK